MLKSRLLGAVGIVAAVGGISGVLTAPVQTKSFFETVSIKSVAPRGNRGQGALTRTAVFQSGGRFTAVNATLHMLIIAAYRGSWPLQLGKPALKVSGGADWTRTDGYDIDAQAEGDPSLDEMEQMLRTVLVERFVLKAHDETQQLPAYKLVMARKDKTLGPELRPSVGPCVNTPLSAAPDPRGLPHCADRFKSRQGRGPLVADATMDQLATVLTRYVGAPVYNQTGLDGTFDVAAQFAATSSQAHCGPFQDSAFGCMPLTSPPTAALSVPPNNTAPSEVVFETIQNEMAHGGAGASASEMIFAAIQKQLGLKLESTKGPGDVVVIDHVERPTED